MKKGFTIGLLIGSLFSMFSVYAATTYYYAANEVSYSPSDTSWNVSTVKAAIDDLKSTSGTALTDLKNTNIAKAVSANGSTLSSVISTLGGITNQANKSFTISNTNSVTIPAGYYNGTGTIKTSGMMVTPTQTLTLSDVTSGTDVTNYKTVKTSGLMKTPTATKSITKNGTAIDVTNYAKVDVNVANVLGSIEHIGGYQYGETQFGDTYTVSEAGLYLVIGVNYAGNTYQAPGFYMSTSVNNANEFSARASDNTHDMEIKGYIVKLNKNDTVGFSGYNYGGEWPFVTIQIWKIG